VAAAAFHSLAPSRWVKRPSSRAAASTPFSVASGQIVPPPTLWVFSTHNSRVGGWTCGRNRCDGGQAARTSSAVKIPWRPGKGRMLSPESAAGAPRSRIAMCAWASQRIWSPDSVWVRSATWLVMVPDGMYTAASQPSSSAVRRSSSRTLGSSP
jgi:hypothetical protein